MNNFLKSLPVIAVLLISLTDSHSAQAREFWRRDFTLDTNYSSLETGTADTLHMRGEIRFSDDRRFCTIRFPNASGSYPCTTRAGAEPSYDITPETMRTIVADQIRAQHVSLANGKRILQILQANQTGFSYGERRTPTRERNAWTMEAPCRRISVAATDSAPDHYFGCSEQRQQDDQPDAVQINAGFGAYSSPVPNLLNKRSAVVQAASVDPEIAQAVESIPTALVKAGSAGRPQVTDAHLAKFITAKLSDNEAGTERAAETGDAEGAR